MMSVHGVRIPRPDKSFDQAGRSTMGPMPSITRNRNPEERRAALDERVLAVVERLLAEGLRYTEISVARILQEAGIARSTFYVHFRDKTDLLSRLAGTLRQNLLEIV